MWTAIAACVVLLALWGLSLTARTAVNTGAPVVIISTIYDGEFWLAWFNGRLKANFTCERILPKHYGLELPMAYADSSSVALMVPLWFPLLFLTAAAVILWRSAYRIPDDCCQKCGYDLTGNISGRCPECGATPSKSQGQAREQSQTRCRWADGLIRSGRRALTSVPPRILIPIILLTALALVLAPAWVAVLILGIPYLAIIWRLGGRPTWPGCCQKCGYNLTGNVSGLCPECGHALAPRP